MYFSRRSLAGLFVLGISALLIAGCSPEAKKAGYLSSADKYFTERDLDRAEVEYLNVLKVDRANPHAVVRLGLIYADQGRFVRSVAFLTKGRELAPEDLDVRIKLGQFYAMSGRPKEAREEAEYVLDRRPTDPDAPLLLAATIAKPEDVEIVRAKLNSLPPPAAAGAPVLVALATIEIAQAHLPAAEELLQRAIAADPKYAGAYGTLANLRTLQRDAAGARQAHQQAANASPVRSLRRVEYAKFLFRSGDAAGAKQNLEEIIRQAPDYLPASLSLAEMALAEKRFPEANGLIDRVLARDVSNLEALLLRGRTRLAMGEPDRAADEFEKLAINFPKLPVAHFELGRARAAAGDTARAIESLNQAVLLAPGNTDAALLLATIQMRKGDLNSSIAQLRRHLQVRPDAVQAQLMLADAYRRQGNFDDAVAIYQTVATQPQYAAQAHLLLGQVLVQMRRNDDARKAFEHAHELAPDNPATIEQLVGLDLFEKKFQAARDRVNAEIARNPKLAGPGQLLLARIALAQGKNDDAEAALKQAIALMPDVPASYYLLASLYNNNRQQAKALESLATVLARNPNDASALMLTGIIQDQEKNYPAARDAYEKLLVINPRASAALNNLAYLYSERLNDPVRAQELAQKARTLLPNDPHVADTLGWILYKRGQYSRAVLLLQEAADKLPAEPELQYHLGMVYYMMGDEDSARTALGAVIASNATFSGVDDARRALGILNLNLARADSTARTTLEKFVAEHPGDPVAQARLAALYEQAGDSAKALAAYEAALKVNDRNVAVLMGLARQYAARKDAAKALEYAKAARKLAPDDPAVARTVGHLAFELGEFTWAYSVLQEAVRKQPDDGELLHDYALAAYSVGQVQAATDALRRAVEINSLSTRNAEAREYLNLVALAADPSSPQAAATAEQTLKAQPKSVPALMVLAAVAERHAEPATARRHYESVLAIYPEFTPAKRSLAIIYSKDQSLAQKAFPLAVRAREAFPDDLALAGALGVIHYQLGNYAKAVQALDDSLAKGGPNAEQLFYLGMSHAKLKRNTEAKAALNKALDLKLSGERAEEARQTLAELR